LTMIEVRRVGDLTEQEENLHRKNLTPIERSETTVRLVIAVGELILWAQLFYEGKTTRSLSGLTAFVEANARWRARSRSPQRWPDRCFPARSLAAVVHARWCVRVGAAVTHNPRRTAERP
jgi:hypothetical protein